MKNRSYLAIFATILSAVTCFGLLSGARAADGDLGGGNTNEGFKALNSLTTGGFNTGLGWYSLFGNSTATADTAVGAGSLVLDNGGTNTAVGAAALLLNTTGSDNNAVGAFALLNNGTGNFNNAHGRGALQANVDGIENEALGDLALNVSVHDSHNTAVGDDALLVQNGGDSNTAVGREAGDTVTTGSHNVFLGDFAGAGTVTASHSIAIGVPATGPFADLSFTCFIGSIDGQPTSDAGSTVPVLIDSNNVLGTSVSSRRFKHDIKPMDKASEALLALKPVTFKYNHDRKGSTQYGLIAEEVAQVNPDLVVYRDGEPFTVKYDQVNVMLLNEFLKADKQVQDLQATVAQQQKGMEVLTAQLKEQAAQIQKVSAQLEVSKPATKVAAGNQ
jgi:hypothetical protein